MFSVDTENSIRESLRQQVAGFEAMGWGSNFLDDFILRNAHEGKAVGRPKGVRKRRDRECFSNSIRALWGGEFPGYHYVEGKACSEHGFIVHHAWLEDDDHNVLDLTWRNPEKAQYFGVTFDIETVRKECIKSGIYGLLCPGEIFNLDLMRAVDPGMNEIINAAIEKRRKK